MARAIQHALPADDGHVARRSDVPPGGRPGPVRVPLGRVLSRTLLDEQDVPAPPRGYRTVRFRTDFANRRGATETLSMERDGDAWKVAGIYLE